MLFSPKQVSSREKETTKLCKCSRSWARSPGTKGTEESKNQSSAERQSARIMSVIRVSQACKTYGSGSDSNQVLNNFQMTVKQGAM
jgi:hypothetical protein